ncbi:uncharacterized protein LOC116182497 [Photinus pyralis]|nr:uncharacterized protein LOC116182497 [Photinus pyralis]
MGKNKCGYVNCTNNRGDRKDLTFFSFPFKNPVRCAVWQKNCGNITIVGKDVTELKHSALCEEHFVKSDIQIRSNRKMLSKTAVPIKYQDTKKETPEHPQLVTTASLDLEAASTSSFDATTIIQTYLPKKRACNPLISDNGTSSEQSSVVSETVINMPARSEIITPKFKHLSYKIMDLKKKLKTKIKSYNRLKAKTSKTSHSYLNLSSILFKKCAHVQTFVKMQCFHKFKTPWSTMEKQLSLSLYYKSPACYKFMRETLKFVLPSIKTIQTWLKVTNLATGVNTVLLTKIKEKINCMNESEKQCVVLFDEISLKRKLEYNNQLDIIEGYQDLGSLGRNSLIGDSALVFYLRGLFYNWKLPFSYYISNGTVKTVNLVTIVKEVLNKIIETSLKPRIIICDQGSNNRGTFLSLGATKESPFFYINGLKVYTCFDPPHLIKSLRNNFINPKLRFIVNDKEVTWKDVCAAYEEDLKSTTTKAMPKLTPSHINPNNFERMRVKYAVQVFSRSVGIGVQTTHTVTELGSTTWKNTVHFILFVNNLFDSLNSKFLTDPNPNRRPISTYNNVAIENLKNGKDMFENIRVYEGSKRRNNIYCIDGFGMTINAILLLWEDLRFEDYKYLVTSFLNQDPLENFFSVVRHRGGYNPYPTVQNFRKSMQLNIFIRLQKEVNSSSNCEEDFGEVIELEAASLESPDGIPTSTHQMGQVTEDEKENRDVQNYPHTSSACDSPPQVSLESCNNTYVAGFIAHRLLKLLKCEICKSILVKSKDELIDSTEIQILLRDFGAENISFLKRPSKFFNSIIRKMLVKFNELFEVHKSEINIRKIIVQRLKELIDPELDNKWECKDHINTFVHYFVRLLIFRKIKDKSLVLKHEKKFKRKVTVLNH